MNFKFSNSEFLIQDFLWNLGILARFFLQRAILFLFSNSSINNKLLFSIVLKLILETFDITINQRSPSNSKSYISDLKIAAPLRLKCEFLRVATHRVALRGAATQRTTQRDATQRGEARGSWLVARGSWLVRIRLSVHQSDERTDDCRSSGRAYPGSNHEPRATSHEPRATSLAALRCVALRCALCCGASQRNAMRGDTEKLAL